MSCAAIYVVCISGWEAKRKNGSLRARLARVNCKKGRREGRIALQFSRWLWKASSRERETKERETCDRGNTRADGRRFPPPPPLPGPFLTLSSSSTRIPSDPFVSPPCVTFNRVYRVSLIKRSIRDTDASGPESLNIVIWILTKFTTIYLKFMDERMPLDENGISSASASAFAIIAVY